MVNSYSPTPTMPSFNIYNLYRYDKFNKTKGDLTKHSIL